MLFIFVFRLLFLYYSVFYDLIKIYAFNIQMMTYMNFGFFVSIRMS